MPLHLLGKKSWNVYNTENIAKVRRDEEAAAAAEEAAEQRMQEADAARRTAILRGETPPPLEDDAESSRSVGDLGRKDDDGAKTWEREDRRKRRKLRGEDDTQRDIRLARDDAEAGHAARDRLKSSNSRDLAITDSRGHIRLFDDPDDAAKAKHSERARKEAERKQRAEEDSMGMRFSHAAGYKTSVGDAWYSRSKGSIAPDTEETNGKNAFGHDDPKRKERDLHRTASSDPMAMMRQAQSKLKQVSREKAQWEEKQREKIRQLEKDERVAKERRRHRRQPRRDEGSDDNLEGFALDAPVDHDAILSEDGNEVIIATGHAVRVEHERDTI